MPRNSLRKESYQSQRGLKTSNMPRILEEKLKKEYPDNPHAVFGTMNKIGAMKGSKETKKGRSIEKALEKKKK